MFDLLIDDAVGRCDQPDQLAGADQRPLRRRRGENPARGRRAAVGGEPAVLRIERRGRDARGDIARRARALLNPRRKPIRLPRIAWRALRRIAWNPVVRARVPRRAYVAYWRLTLVVDDGFWFDPRKALQELALPLVTLDEGLRQMIEAAARETTR
jgi:hypothetical protein